MTELVLKVFHSINNWKIMIFNLSKYNKTKVGFVGKRVILLYGESKFKLQPKNK